MNGLRDAPHPQPSGRGRTVRLLPCQHRDAVSGDQPSFDGRRHRPRYTERHRQAITMPPSAAAAPTPSPGMCARATAAGPSGRLNEGTHLHRHQHADRGRRVRKQMTNAVRRFQRQFSLSADGILGKDTWNKIVPCITPYGQATPRTLPLSIRRTAARRLHRRLRPLCAELSQRHKRPSSADSGRKLRPEHHPVGLFPATAGLPLTAW